MKKLFLALGLLASLIYGKKFVVLDPSTVETMYALNAERQIAAIATTMAKIYPAEKTSQLPSVGSYIKPSLEKIIESKPDMVFASFHSQGIVADLDKFKIPNVIIKADSVDDIYKNISLVAQQTGTQARAEVLIKQIKDNVSKHASDFGGKKIAILYQTSPLMAFNTNSLVGDIFAKLGFSNIASDLSAQTPILTPETLLVKNPDYIVVVAGMGGSKDEILAQYPSIAKTNAAKNGKIISVSPSLILRGTPRIAENLEKIVELLKQ